MAFNRIAAKKAGWTDTEIDTYLKSKSGLPAENAGTSVTSSANNVDLNPLEWITKTLLPRTTDIFTNIDKHFGPQGDMAATNTQGNFGDTLRRLGNFINGGVGVAGEIAPYAATGGTLSAPASLPAVAGASGFIHGVTDPNADIGQRATQGAVEGSIGALLGTIFGPLLRPGATRYQMGSTKGVDTGALTDVLNKSTENQLMGTSARKAQNYVSDILTRVAPLEGTTQTGLSQAPQVGVNALYKTLNQFEKETGAFPSTLQKIFGAKGNTVAADVSSAARGLINQTHPDIKMINQYMSLIRSPKLWGLLTLLGGGAASRKLQGFQELIR